MATDGTKITVEVTALNGNEYFGELSELELLYIWENTFKRKKAEIMFMSTKRSLNRSFRASFVLDKVVELRDFYPEATFEFLREIRGGVDKISCRLVGYSKVKPAEIGSLTRITVSTNDFTVKPADIVQWLSCFGSVSSSYDFEKNSLGIRTDVFETEIVLRIHIPEFLPIGGRKVQVYYPGIPKACIKCFEFGHMKRNCKGVKVEWVERVAQLRATGAFKDEMFGSWIGVLDGMKQ